MQKTSDLYQQLLQTDYSVDTRLAIGEPGVLITKRGEAITFGGVAILTGATGADGGYDETLLMSMETANRLFSEDTPEEQVLRQAQQVANEYLRQTVPKRRKQRFLLPCLCTCVGAAAASLFWFLLL